MLKLNVNETKKLKFNIRVSGVEPKDLRGSLKIMIEGVEFGFPIETYDDNILVSISPFSTISGREFKDGETFDAQLDIIAGDTYLNPWTDRVVIDNPMKVEATLSGIDEISETITPEIKISSLEEEKIEKKKEKKIIEKKEPKTKFGKMLEE